MVELLVVIAVIGILIALLLPAVQAAREAARRTRCANNLKQLALAVLNYESAFKCFPPGAINEWFPCGSPRTTWTIHLYPFMEQENVYDRFDFRAAPGAGGAVWTNAANSQGTNPPTAAVIQALLCPSDGRGGQVHHHMSGCGDFARGNYAGFFGNLDYGAAQTPNVLPHRPATFGFNHSVRISQITDGTSNTMALGECLTGTGADNDFRGVHWYDHVACSQIYTKFGPNTAAADVFLSMWCSANTNQPQLNLPCIPSSSGQRDETAASRSRHPGGVQVAYCDGSVRFMADTIDLVSWQAVGSISWGEVVTAIP